MRRRNLHGDPSRLEALQILGLGPGASQRQVKRAYRRLALRYHPDRACGEHLCATRTIGSPPEGPSISDRQVRFRQVARAYAVLERCFVAVRADRDYGRCDRCHDFEPLQIGLDGNAYCRECLLTAHGKRALPAPPMVVAECGLTTAGLAVSAAALAAWTSTGQWVYWWISVTASAAAMTALAVVCLTGQHVVPRQRRRPRFTHARRRSLFRRLYRLAGVGA